MLAIKNNMMAANAARYLGRSYEALATSVERLSSGLRINSAADDAAGMAVRELMRADIGVLQQGGRNTQDGISMLQTMEGALQTINNNLVRMQQLATQAATGSYTEDQRKIMNAEFTEMANEIERIAKTTHFNGIHMLDNVDPLAIRFGTSANDEIEVVGADVTKVSLGIDAGEGKAEYVASKAGVADATANWVNLAADRVFQIKFGAEETITVNLATGNHSMQAVANAINAASRAASDYNAAEVVNDTATNQYRLKISAKEGGDVGVDFTGTTALDDAAEGALHANGFLNVNGSDGGLVNILDEVSAKAAMTAVSNAILKKDEARAAFGYKINRLESTAEVLGVQMENLMTAESRISDVDVATEMAILTRNQVLAQAGTAMLAQANSIPQMALMLLR
jgi:flagellin